MSGVWWIDAYLAGLATVPTVLLVCGAWMSEDLGEFMEGAAELLMEHELWIASVLWPAAFAAAAIYGIVRVVRWTLRKGPGPALLALVRAVRRG